MKLSGPSHLVNPLDRRRFMGFGTGAGGGASFVGPYDGADLTLIEGWSTARRLFTETTSILRLRADRTGQPEQDLTYDSNGLLDGAAAFLGSDTGYGRRIFGQKGVADFVQATSSVQPAFNASGINGNPTLLGDGAGDVMTAAGLGSQTTWWAFIVCRFAAAASVANKEVWAFEDYPSSTNFQLLETIGGDLYINSSRSNVGPLETLAAGTIYAFLYEGSAAAGTLRGDNGGLATTATSHIRADEIMSIFTRGDGGNSSNIHIGEMLLGSGALDDTKRAAIWQSAADFWGTDIP